MPAQHRGDDCVGLVERDAHTLPLEPLEQPEQLVGRVPIFGAEHIAALLTVRGRENAEPTRLANEADQHGVERLF